MKLAVLVKFKDGTYSVFPQASRFDAYWQAKKFAVDGKTYPYGTMETCRKEIRAIRVVKVLKSLEVW